MCLSVTAGEQGTVVIRYVHFGEQGTRAWVDRLGRAHHFALEILAGILSKLQVGAESRANRGRVSFWHADISANGIRLRERKELLRCAAVSRIDQRARIHAAPRNDAAERRINMLEGFQFFEPPHVGFRGSYVGDFGFQIPDGVIDFLLRDAVGLDEFLVTRCGDPGEIRVGLCGIEFGARLRQLLIHFGSVDVRQQLALPDAAADVVIPLFQIAVGARIDGRFDIGLHGAGEDEVLLRRFHRGMNHGHGGNRQRFRFLGERLILGAALEQRYRPQNHQHHHDNEKNREDPAGLSALLLLVYKVHLNSAFHLHPISTFNSR